MHHHSTASVSLSSATGASPFAGGAPQLHAIGPTVHNGFIGGGLARPGGGGAAVAGSTTLSPPPLREGGGAAAPGTSAVAPPPALAHSSSGVNATSSRPLSPIKGKGGGGDPAASMPESIRKLRALKDSISKELETEKRLRVEADSQDMAVPLSLVNGDGTPFAGGVGGASSPVGGGRRTAAGAAAVQQQLQQSMKEKFAGMKEKLDKNLQRDIEIELEKHSTETVGLKAHNARLRDIITLRQQCSSRREAELNAEVQRLQTLCDSLCVDANDMPTTMAMLHGMNQQIQSSAAMLKRSIEEQAESDRLQLIRQYRVKIREVRQQVVDQNKHNLEGAKTWIARHDVLESDVETAQQGLRSLRETIDRLRAHNQELELMCGHQKTQREQLTTRVAVVKRENKQLDAYIKTLEAEVIAEAKGAGSGAIGQRPATVAAADHTDGSPTAGGGSASSSPSSVRGVRRGESRGGGQGAARIHGAASTHRVGAASASSPTTLDSKQEHALLAIRSALDDMRRSLKQVRAAHVELLQERTELQIFMRQCMEDVRRDIFRHAVVSGMGRTTGDSSVKLLEDYTATDRKKLTDVLQSKLRVYSQLHSAMFPQKPLQLDELAGVVEGHDYVAAVAKAKQTGDGVAAGLPHLSASAAMDLDHLWDKWKKWTTAM